MKQMVEKVFFVILGDSTQMVESLKRLQIQVVKA